MRKTPQHLLIIREVPGVGLLERHRGPGGECVGDQREGLPVAGTQIEDIAIGRHELAHRGPQHRHEKIALVGTHHEHAPQWIGFQQAREGIPVLTVAIESRELVVHQFEGLVEARSEGAERRFVNQNRHTDTLSYRRSYILILEPCGSKGGASCSRAGRRSPSISISSVRSGRSNPVGI